jgi:hypothetical protein
MEQVKSKKRVTDHGEVFTNSREVNAMLDLVKQETDRIDSRFLEPACGNGNFLAEVLNRKLDVVDARYGKSLQEWEHYSIVAISSIYGVDILEDNAKECRERLFDVFNQRYTNQFDKNCKEECRRSIRFLLSRNILWGDALDFLNGALQQVQCLNEGTMCLDFWLKKHINSHYSMIKVMQLLLTSQSRTIHLFTI